ncbi:MAG: UDP-N-acetylmuramoyl-L-alanyl-D-glutamate--2,6-diaminopimelate ligase [Thermoleophilia bacterium]
MTLTELIGGIPGARLLPRPGTAADPGETRITAVAHRADLAAPGTLFCAVPGLRADGHDFAAEAVARGAAAVLVERPLDLAVPQVVVPDARLATALVAAAINGHPSRDLVVVGVTGTNGKTTSAILLRAVLEAAGHRCGLVGTIEARVGGEAVPVSHTTPDAPELQSLFARMRDAGDTACAMEVSSHALVQRRTAGTRFAAALFTNLTRDHLDYHPDVEDYYAAKRLLFRRAQGEGEDPPGAANLDDEFGARLARETGALGYAVDAPADVRPVRVDGLTTGIAATIDTPRGPLDVETRLRGRFNLANIAGVVAASELLALPHGAVAEGLAAVPGVPGRFEAVDEGQPFPVIVDYAHTPDSLDNVLRAARELVGDGGRLLAVFGCGGDRDRGKRPQMGAVARDLADVAVVTSDNPRGEDPDAIIADILEGMDGAAELRVLADRRAAISWAVDRARPGDVVVVAGKGHEQGQERNGVKTPFDDRAVAREALRARGRR